MSPEPGTDTIWIFSDIRKRPHVCIKQVASSVHVDIYGHRSSLQVATGQDEEKKRPRKLVRVARYGFVL